MLKKSDAGKGDDDRINFNYKNFWTNFSLISSCPDRPKTYKSKKILKNGVTRYTY